LLTARGLVPLNWLMIGQWARKPSIGAGCVEARK
jgi:hypothetical protein